MKKTYSFSFISKRASAGRIHDKIVRNSSDIAHYYMEKMKDYKKEYLIAVMLDSKNKIIKDKVTKIWLIFGTQKPIAIHLGSIIRSFLAFVVISIGTLDSSLVHPREVFKEAIKAEF